MDTPPIIYDVVLECLNLFENLTGRADGDLEDSVSPRGSKAGAPEDVEYMQQIFSRWVSSTGVLLTPDDSLDHRLRFEWKTKAVVVGLLQEIKMSLQQLDVYTEAQKRPRSAAATFLANYKGHLNKPKVAASLNALSRGIDNLRVVSAEIVPKDEHDDPLDKMGFPQGRLLPSPRRPANPHLISAPAAPRPDPIDEDDLFFERDMARLLRRWFPRSRRTLLEQLAASILGRRRQAVALIRHLEKFDQGGNKCFVCSEPLENLSTVELQKHATEQIEAYVCISDECLAAPLRFRFYQDWVDHMKSAHTEEWPSLIHIVNWYCDIEHPREDFYDQGSFETHMQDTLMHPTSNKPSDRQLESLVRQKTALAPRDRFVCPFCEDIPDQILPILNISGPVDASLAWSLLCQHVGVHLRSVAHLAHPQVEIGSTAAAASSAKATISSNSWNGASDDTRDSEVGDRGVSAEGPSSDAEDYDLSDREYVESDRVPDLNDVVTQKTMSELLRHKLEDDPPPFNFLHSATQKRRREDLATRLAMARVQSEMDHRPFVPLSSLQELLTKDAIELELVNLGVFYDNVDFILHKSLRLFAILLTTNMTAWIPTFASHNLSDDSLPLSLETFPKFEVSREAWSYVDMTNFVQSQWMFLAPVFKEGEFQRRIHNQCPLPFTAINRNNERMGAFSLVRQVSVHPAHFIVQSEDITPFFAVKQLPSEVDKPTQELEVAVKMRSLRHPHLVRPLMAYERDGKQSIIFNWAPGGNLRDAWVQLEKQRGISSSQKLLLWTLTELQGLASALESLHARNYRHGDLKPENILCFESRGKGETFTLKLGDLGLAKFHDTPTRQRRQATSMRYATWRYEPPESLIAPRQPMSRRADVWSLGCVVMEFLIWLRYGADELDRFGGSFMAFCSTVGQDAVVDPVVCRWMDHMERDPRCGSGTAIGEVLWMLRRRLLVPATRLPSTTASAQANAGPSLSEPLTVTTTTAATDLERAPEFAERASALEIRSRLGDIVRQARHGGSVDIKMSGRIGGGRWTGPPDEPVTSSSKV